MFFVDAAHFIWQGYLGFLWCFARVWLGSATGRKRFNVLGALNAVTYEVLTVCNNTYINSESITELLYRLRKRFLETRIPISIILDNAAYQRCYQVEYLAKLMEIELVFMPPYSPNLNLIERLWKFVKNKCVYGREYNSFEEYSQAIQHCTEKAHVKYKSDLTTLLKWNFQSFKHVKQGG